MSITVKKVALAEQRSELEGQTLSDNYSSLLDSVEVECSVRVGTLNMTISELRQLKSGQALQLNQKTSEPLDLILNGRVIARGELMSYEDNFAIQIKEVKC
jgi:flagellar motor switch protein FliN/FliY